ncbi:MAG: hypothetical protein RBQ99_04340 [Trichlorobacter sp.]|jgi:hypothetical protein|nr:hypothetical protein [Trichlorobacter sp.]
MQDAFSFIILILLAFIASIPCGYIREYFRKFSIPWLLMAHMSIPLIYHMRNISGFGWKVIPFTLASAILGQIIGGKIKRRIKSVPKTSQRLD